MKLTYTSTDGSLKIEADPKSMKDAMDALGCIHEYLMPEPCGCCQSKDTYARKKTTGEYTYFQWACKKCGAEFYFGQYKEGGGLFPKRTDKEGPLPNRGWSVYKPNSGHQAPARNGYSQEPAREPQDYSQENEVPF